LAKQRHPGVALPGEFNPDLGALYVAHAHMGRLLDCDKQEET